jgi:hypothetical protein
MNTTWMILTLETILAAGTAAGQELTVTVRLYDYAGVLENVLQKAKLEAMRMIRDAGVETRWLDYTLRDGHIQPLCPACEAPVSPADIRLQIVPRSMEPSGRPEGRLGFSRLFAGEWPANQAYVLYHRVRDVCRQYQRVSEFKLLACLMAHEFGHLLLGHDRHSLCGLMMANWEEKDLDQIGRGMMTFSPEEARLLVAAAIKRMRAYPQH